MMRTLTTRRCQPLARRTRGFTLIEILVVVVILGILGAVVGPNLLERPEQARVQAAKTQLQSIGSALDLYRLDNFSYPSTDQGIEALVTKPSGFPEAKNWAPGGYYNKEPKDPWGNDFAYTNNGQGFELICYGADGAQGGEGPAADINLNDVN